MLPYELVLTAPPCNLETKMKGAKRPVHRGRVPQLHGSGLYAYGVPTELAGIGDPTSLALDKVPRLRCGYVGPRRSVHSGYFCNW